MTSTLAISLAAFFGVATVVFGWWGTYLLGKDSSREGIGNTKKIISNQNETKSDILNRQSQDTQAVLSAVASLREAQESNADRLSNAFPAGYVLIGVQPNGNLVHLPFNTGKAEFLTDWHTVRIRLDREKKFVFLSIPNFTYAVPGQQDIGIFECGIIDYRISYAVGAMIRVSVMNFDNPEMFFGVLNDDPNSAQYVIGFKS